MRINLSKFLQLQFNIFLYKKLGWGVAIAYIIILGRLYFFFNRKEKEKIKSAVMSAFNSKKSDNEIRHIYVNVVKGILSHYYEKLFNAFSTSEELKIFFQKNMSSEGLTPIENGLARGKGVLLVTGHFGGVEFTPGYLAAKNLPVTIIVRFSSRHLRNISIEKAEHFSTRIIDADKTANVLRAIHDNLKENRIVITQCDEIDEWRPSGDSIMFMGNWVKLDRTINILTKRLDTFIAFSVVHRIERGKYKFIVNSLEDISRKYQNQQYKSNGALLIKFLEQQIYRYPEEWYQWKKYFDIIENPAAEKIAKKPASTPAPLMRPVFDRTS